MVLPNKQGVLSSSRSVADRASVLGAALSASDSAQINEAVDALLLSYDAYSNSAAAASTQFAFADLMALPGAELRDQGSAESLAGVLLDLEMASLLGETARLLEDGAAAPGATAPGATVPRDIQRLQQLSAGLQQTVNALEGADPLAGGVFAFTEVLAAAPEITPSADLAQALQKYEEQATQIYQTLLEQTTELLKFSFKELDQLDLSKVSNGLKQVLGPMDWLVGQTGLVRRALDALQRAVDGLRKMLGKDLVEKSESQLKEFLEKVKQGESPTQAFLKFSYGVDPGAAQIKTWLEQSKTDLVSVDAGALQLAELHQRVVQAYAVHLRIVKTLRSLDDIFLWLLKKVGVGVPLDLLLYGVFLLDMDIALLQGMDYADTTTLVKWVDGVLVISQRVLAS